MDVTGCWLPYLKHSGYAWVAALHRGSFHSVHKDRLLSGASEKNLLYLLRCRDLELIEIYNNNNKKDHLSLSLHQELPFDGKFQSAFLWDTTFITWDNLIILKKIFVLFLSLRATATPICQLETCWGKSELERGQSLDSSLPTTSRRVKLSLWRSPSTYSGRYAPNTSFKSCLCLPRKRQIQISFFLGVRNYSGSVCMI